MSFLEDNIIPFPFCQKVNKEEVNPVIKQKSWKRRVNVNSFHYFGIIIVFAVLKVLSALKVIPLKANWEDYEEQEGKRIKYIPRMKKFEIWFHVNIVIFWSHI